MLDVSPYADAESGAPSWRTGERESAIVFLSLALYIILDVNVSIYRVFRRKQGLYYWSLMCATWGTAVVVVGNIFKNLKPEWGFLWIGWTIAINGGWSVYAPAELLVLYSRLHLVDQNEVLHRRLLVMIIVGSTLIIIPNWVFIFPAYNIDPTISAKWSPRMAIIDRVSQAGFTLFEIIISSIYINSLRDILKSKINTRTRRVMRDLIFVNITVISMDLLVIILIFLNQANLAYPLQDLTYAFKFKIEFAVLNQLMAVAASRSHHGSRQTTWEEKRYRRPGQATILKGFSDDDLTGIQLPFSTGSTDGKPSPQSTLVANDSDLKATDTTDHAAITKPPSVITKDQSQMDGNVQCPNMDDADLRTLDQGFAFAPAPDLAFSAQYASLSGTTNSDRTFEKKESNDRLLAPIADDVKDHTLVDSNSPTSQSSQQTDRQRMSLLRAVLGRPLTKNFQMPSNRSTAQVSAWKEEDESAGITIFHKSSQQNNAGSGASKTIDAREPSLRPKDRRLGSKSNKLRGRENGKDNDDHDADESNDEEKNDLHSWERGGERSLAMQAPWFPKRDKSDQSPVP